MFVDEADRTAFKDWVVPKLEKISDADAGVLADYVIALIVAEDTEDAVRQNCLGQLGDFLQDHTGPFIDDVLNAVKSKSFLPQPKPAAPPPSAPTLLPSPALSAEAPPFNPPSGPSALSQSQSNSLPGLGSSPPSGRGEQSRKRRYNDRETSQSRDGHDPHYRRGAGDDRPLKQAARRGGRNSRGGVSGQEFNMNRIPMQGGIPGSAPSMPNYPSLPTPPPGFPALNHNDPMAFLAMMGLGLSGMPPLPLAGSPMTANPLPINRQSRSRGRKGRCRDYDTKGYCALGSACPYEHGGEIVLPPTAEGIQNFLCPTSTSPHRLYNSLPSPRHTQLTTDQDMAEYDPTKASLTIEDFRVADGPSRRNQDRGQKAFGRGGYRGGRTRAPFSHPGPIFDHSNSTVVVEQIPEENFSEDAVRNFFSQFGSIVDVKMQAYKRLAIVKFDDHFAARRAYDSPKVIFDNRFVKVYWYKAESLPTPSANKTTGAIKGSPPPAEGPETYKQDEEMLDPEEIEKRQAEAQIAFEERQKKAQEAEARMEKVAQELKEKEEQMRLLKEKLMKKSSSKSDAQLSSLQAEAQELEANYDIYSAQGRGRGGYRGRGYYPPRGRGFTPFRGSYRGRGFTQSPYVGGRGGVKRWDNRPKRIAISGVGVGSPKDEALRQHLVNNYEYESIDPHPEDADTQIITFKERYVAEMFLDQASEIPDVGKVELAWVPNAPISAKTEPIPSDQPASEGDVKMEEPKSDEHTATAAQANGSEDMHGNANGGEADYDVADDEDRWRTMP